MYNLSPQIVNFLKMLLSNHQFEDINKTYIILQYSDNPG